MCNILIGQQKLIFHLFTIFNLLLQNIQMSKTQCRQGVMLDHGHTICFKLKPSLGSIEKHA